MYHVPKPAKTRWNVKDFKGFAREERYCQFHHWKYGGHFEYPDGWPEEDLREWCLKMGVPEPTWNRTHYYGETIQNKFLSYDTIFAADPLIKFFNTAKFKKAVPGQKIAGQILFSGTFKVQAPKYHSQIYGFTAGGTAGSKLLDTNGLAHEDFDFDPAIKGGE